MSLLSSSYSFFHDVDSFYSCFLYVLPHVLINHILGVYFHCKRTT